jgi:YVTN family beta-propeller protein
MAIPANEPGSPPHPNAISTKSPPSFSGHYYAGSEYNGPGKGVKDVQVALQVPNGTPDGASFYYVLLSVWDNAGSYDQLGFSDDYGTWGVTYSTTSYCAGTYYYDPDAQALQQGQDYLFEMSLVSGNVSLSASYASNATLLWSDSVETGASNFEVRDTFTCDNTSYVDYTDYEEVYATVGPLVPYDFFFTNNSASGSLVSRWSDFLSSSPPAVSVFNNDSNVTIENEPTDLILSPAEGVVGSIVSARGIGFGANSTITFRFAGVAVNSDCSTNSTGDFLGSIGNACSFTVPVVPGGTERVGASDGRITVSTAFAVHQSLTLSPAIGPVGTHVAAGGTGFSADSPVTFTSAGMAMASICSTDSTGSFPGASGTSCILAMPTAPSGNESVVASTSAWATLRQISVGGAPGGLAYDSSRGEVFVANIDSDTVSVISDSSDTVVATIAVGSYPFGVAYDSDRGEVFVTNLNSGTVSVISDATDTVVATIVVGGYPTFLTGVAYDASKGEIFVANQDPYSVSVISDSTNTVVATLPVGSYPYGLAYDPDRGEVFEANDGSNNVSVISDTTNRVVSTIPVGETPTAVAYDSSKGEVFVTNLGSNNVSVIADATNRVVSTISIESSPTGIAYDSSNGEVLVTTGNSNSLSVISDSTDTVTSTAAVGSDPYGVVYDSGLGELFVADSGSNDTSVLAPTAATATFVVKPSVSFPDSPAGVDLGQTATVQMNGFGSSVSISVFTLGPYSLYCTSATTGTCARGALTTASTGSIVATFFVSSAFMPGPYLLMAVDAAGNRATMNTTVNIDPTVATPTSLPRDSVDLGQSVTFTTSASLGTGDYSYDWLGLPSGCSGHQASIGCTPTTVGSFWVAVNAIDSSGFAVSSGTLAFVVYPALNVTAPTASQVSADVGQAVTFSAATSGGSGEIASIQWSGLPTGCVAASTSSISCRPTATGIYSISVNVTDSDDFTASSGTLSFSVFTDLVVSSFSASPGSVLDGSSVTFLATTTGGKAPFTYAYPGLPPGCSSTNNSTFHCTPSAAGTFTVEVIIHDGNGFEATRNVTLTVNPQVLGLPAAEGYVVIGGAVTLVAVAAVVAVILSLRRGAPRSPAR